MIHDPTRTNPEDALLEQAAEEYFAAVSRGESPSISEYAERYPTIAKLIRNSFPALALVQGNMHTESTTRSEVCTPKVLGEFKILREIGRGGMGIVFEAEQQSLGRRVALKILPFAAMLDPTRLVRFKNEIRAAGTLDHEHIVSIYSVGEERGIHYYAMQLIQGQSIARVVDQLRATNLETTSKSIAEAVSQSMTQEQEATHENDVDQTEVSKVKTEVNSPARTELPNARRTSGRERREFYQAVARVGEQAALALEHAHERGVIHRDIKPANLLIDAYCDVFITDFGLARIEADAGLTMTGDLLGTLRYMAPEQLSGSPSDVTHHADIYSFGVTLYELLALRPAFAQDDRGKLVEQITRGEPVALRKLVPTIPADLETIVSKAIEREPLDRYRTAQELAEDLRRFREDQPVRAKPPTLLDRTVKWSRRHSDLAWTIATFLVLFTIGSAVAVGTILNLYRESELQRERAQTAKEVAETHRLELQQELYSLDMQEAFTAWEDGRVDIVEPLLAKHEPAQGRPDVRSFGWYALKEYTSRPEPLSLKGHQGSVREVAIHPDSLRLVSVGDDGTIRTWNSSTGELLSTIKASNKSLNALAVSPKGRRIVTGNRSLQLWDLERAALVDSLAEFESTIEEAAFSPDGRFVAAGSRDSVIRIINMQSRNVVTLDVQCANESLLFTDGGTTITGTCKEAQGKMIRSWDCETGQVRREFSVSNGNAELTTTSSKGERLVLAGTGKPQISFWDAKSGSEFYKAPTSTGRLNDIALAPNDATLVAASGGGTLRYWSLDPEWTLEGLERVIVGKELVFPAHYGEATSIAFLDNKHLVSCGEDGLIKVWKGHQPRRRTRHLPRSDGKLSAFVANADKVLSFTTDGQLELWDIESNDVEWRIPSPRDSVKLLQFAAAGLHFVAVDDENHVDVWRIGREKPLLSFQHPNRLLHAALSPDGQMVAVTGRDGETLVRNVTTAEQVFEVTIDGWGYAVKFSPNGRLLALGGEIPEIRMFDTASWRIVHRLPGSSDTRLLEFSADGESLASRQADSFLRIWDTKSGTLKAALDTRDQGYIHSVAFHPDGQCLAIGSNSQTVRLWHLPTQRELGVGMQLLESKIKHAYQLTFSPDGRKLLALVKKHNDHKFKTRYLDILETDYQSPSSSHSTTVVGARN